MMKRRLPLWAALLAAAALLLLAGDAGGPRGAHGAPARRRKATGANKVELSDAFFRKWAPFKDLDAFLGQLHSTYKHTKLVKLSSIGRSAERRPLSLLSVGPAAPKHQIMLMATMHGREWIAPYATLWTAWQLLKEHAEGVPRAVRLLRDTQVHFLPVLNPDGYEFSRLPAAKNEQARNWRKNRRALCSKCERGVHGVDLNRNWGVKGTSWGFGNTKATTEVYQGKHPFSEPEVSTFP